MTETTPLRLPAAERRQAILETAVDVFTSGSYRGCTTAEIARRSGISEPILYRHFGSKRDLYLAVLDHVWEQLHELCEQAIAAEPDPALWLAAIGTAYLGRSAPGALLVQSLEAAHDPDVRARLHTVFRELHAFLADVIRRAQAAGGLLAERDPEAEAWLFLAGGMLGTLGSRIGFLDEDDVARIRASRSEWLSGRKLA
jgi:AcrR family transcriptional regulator